jgi:hypothetical protein
MAVRDDFAAGEVLAAADLNDTFASKLPYSYGTATPSTTDSGFLWYDSNSTPAEVKFWDGAAFQALTSGKILQIVRATDTTNRTTTSTSYVDLTGMSVTITPTKSDSAVLLLCFAQFRAANISTGSSYAYARMTDSSNNSVSGAEDCVFGVFSNVSGALYPTVISGYVTPATTSAVTYKIRGKTDSANVQMEAKNAEQTMSFYAIEVSA